MIDRGLIRRARDGRAWMLGVALVVAPMASGCVSAVDDSSAFGFNSGATEKPASALADAAAGGDAPPVSSDASAGADAAAAEQIAAAARGAGAAEVAAPAPASGSGSKPSAQSPFLANTASIAAYSGGTVRGNGDEAARSGNNGTRFGSLFASAEPRTPLPNADRTRSRRVILEREGAPTEVGGGGDNALPGVDASSLFEIGQRASLDDEEFMEDTGAGDGSYEVASLSGLARLAPNGLLVQREDIVTQCFEPKLVGMLRAIERKFGKRVVVTSGYRSPAHNRRVNGARHSQHMACKAADIVVPGVDRFELANFARTLPGRGGVGTYCHTAAVHVDVGRQRDWNWGCRRRG